MGSTIPERKVWWVLALALWVVGIFAVSTTHPFAHMDVGHYLLGNPQIVDPFGGPLADLLFQPHIGYIVPVTGLSEALLYWAGQGQPWIFHLAGLLLHLLNGVLLFTLLLRLGSGARGAFVASLIFALHPVVVEPVAWSIGLKDLWMACFALAGTHLTLSARRALPGRTLGLWAAVGACALLAVLSKPTGALIPLAWIAWGILRAPGRSRFSFPGRGLLLGVFGINLIITAMSWFMHSQLLSQDTRGLEGGWHVLLALGHQTLALLWPANLQPRYPALGELGLADGHAWLGLAVLLLLGLAAWRSRKAPVALLGLILAAAAYLPVSNLIPFQRARADSYLYLPLAGLLIFALGAGKPLQERLARLPVAWRRAALAAVVVFLAGLSALTWSQLRRWSSPVSLWLPVIEANERWPFGWMQLGEGLAFADRPAEARLVYQQLYARDYPRDYLANLAAVLFRLDLFAEAECVFVEDLYLGADSGRAQSNLLRFYAQSGERTLRYPRVAHPILTRALNPKNGARPLPPAWVGRLRTRLANLPAGSGDGGPMEAWSPRTCPDLQAARIDLSRLRATLGP